MTTSEQQAVPVAQEQESALATAFYLLDALAGEGLSQTCDDGRTIEADDTVHALCSAFYMEPDIGWYRDLAAELAPTSLPCKSGEGAGEAFLDQLRRVNLARYEAWVEGADAGIMFDAIELGGEVGELLNVVKKLEREERGWRGSRAAPEDFADECADVLICLDKLARRRNVDLAAVTISKFNATSERVGLPHRLEASLGSGAPAEQEVSVSVAKDVEARPVGDPEIIQVEDRASSQREAEGVPRDHVREDSSDNGTREAVLAHAVANILPLGDDRAPGDRVIPIYVRMDELRALRRLAALSAGAAS